MHYFERLSFILALDCVLMQTKLRYVEFEKANQTVNDGVAHSEV